MSTSTLAILILVSTIIYFVVSRMSLRPGKEVQALIMVSRILAVVILGLTLFYFYLRVAG